MYGVPWIEFIVASDGNICETPKGRVTSFGYIMTPSVERYMMTGSKNHPCNNFVLGSYAITLFSVSYTLADVTYFRKSQCPFKQ